MASVAFVHEPVPPFTIIAGPIDTVSQKREFALSKMVVGEIEIAVPDITDQSWIRPGMAWSISSDLGQPYWAGFVEVEERIFGASSVRIKLLGPMRGILDGIEVFSSTQGAGLRGVENEVRNVLEFALSRNAGITLGEISVPPNFDFQPQGDTVAKFVQSVTDRTDVDYLETMELKDNQLVLRLQVGSFLRKTTHVISQDDIIAGNFTRDRPVNSVTVVGAGNAFSTRSAATTAAVDRPRLGQAVSHAREPAPQHEVGIVERRDIGPAATRHQTVIEERVSVGIEDQARATLIDDLRAVDRVGLTLDMSRTVVQALRVGDVFRLKVEDWMGGVGVEALLHIRTILPHEETGKMNIVAWVRN